MTDCDGRRGETGDPCRHEGDYTVETFHACRQHLAQVISWALQTRDTVTVTGPPSRDPPGPVVHLRGPVVQLSGRWRALSLCGHGRFGTPNLVLADETSEATCRRCLLMARGIANLDDGNALEKLRANADRLMLLLRRVEEGATLREMAAEVGVSAQRVNQILTARGVNMSARQAQRVATRRADAGLRRILERMAHATPCAVCGAWNLRGAPAITCSAECARAYKFARHRLDPEAHRRAMAESHLRHVESVEPGRLDWAHRVLAGAPPNRRFRTRASKATRLLELVGRADLLPDPPPTPTRNCHRCAATNLDGRPCSRTVATEGDVCHIHAGKAGKARRAAL